MAITAKQLSRIALHLPKQRGNVSHKTLNVINAILYVAESGSSWRALPKRFGNWHTIYTRMNRWAKAGVLDRVFAELERQYLIRIRIETVIPDRMTSRVATDTPDACNIAARKRSKIPTGDTARTFQQLPRARLRTDASMAATHGAGTNAEQDPGKWLRS
jgi:transposase